MARRRTNATPPAAAEASTTAAPEEVTTDGAPDTGEEVDTRDADPAVASPTDAARAAGEDISPALVEGIEPPADDASAPPADAASEAPAADAPPADEAPPVSEEQTPAQQLLGQVRIVKGETGEDHVKIFVEDQEIASGILDDDGRLLLDSSAKVEPATLEDRGDLTVQLEHEAAAATARADLADVTIGELQRQLAEARTQGFVPTSAVEVEPGEPPVIPSGVEPKAAYDEPSPYVIAGPETTAEGWGAGQVAPADRYGITGPDGVVTPTGRNGLDEPPAGAYGALLIRKGDTITPAQLAAVGLGG